MKVGLSQLIVPREWRLAEVVRNAKAAGYECIEVRPADGSEITLDTPDAELEALARMAADEGIEIVSSCGSGGRPMNLMTDDETLRRESIENSKAMLRVVAYANALRSLQELAPAAEEMGVSIAVEYVWNGFLTSPLEMAQFLAQVASPAVGFFFDPGNMRIFHHSEHWAHICGPWIKKVHAKDFSWEGHVVAWPPLLEGQVNFPAVMRELRAAGYDGALISEVSLSAASLEETAAAIRKIIAL